MSFTPKRAPLWALVVANLIPVAGIFLFGWDARDVAIIYWLETSIVAILAFLRIWLVQDSLKAKLAATCALATFFVLGFTIYGAWLFYLIGRPLMTLGDFIPVLGQYRFAVSTLFVSHALSFFMYFMTSERASSKALIELARPIGRMMTLHMTVIVTLVVFVLITKSTGASFFDPAYRYVSATCLAVVKIWSDINSHIRSHRKMASA